METPIWPHLQQLQVRLQNRERPVMILLLASFFVLAILLHRIWTRDPRRKHLPPLVPGIPIINQTFWHMKENLSEDVMRWAQQYGEVFRTRSGTTDWIWLNTPEAVKDVIDRQSAVTSSRMFAPMNFGAATGSRRMLFMPYGERWRSIRSIIHRLLMPAATKSYAPIQQYEAKQLSVDLLNDPKNFYMHNRRYSASLIMQVVYGRRLPQFECYETKEIYAVMGRFAEIRRVGQWLVDVYPSLANNPIFNLFSNWRKRGNEIHRLDSAVWLKFWREMNETIQKGTAPHSFGKGFVQSDWQQKGFDELQAAYICGTMIEASSETTSTQLNNTLIGILSRGREVLDAAHEELDRVIGKDRTPTFDDEKNLPYIRAMVKEIHRWRFVNKHGTEHYVSEDLWYKGWFIPKGSQVVISSWPLHYDPIRYPEPSKYEPMRYINHTLSAAESIGASDPALRDHYGYGSGRRVCPGMHLAERSLFLNIARLLWGFDILPAKDEHGNDAPPDPTLKGCFPGAMNVPKPFDCVIRVRSPQHEQVLRQEWADAQAAGLHVDDIKFSTK